MFKNITLFKFSALNFDRNAVESALQTAAFAPCSPSQERSSGWVPPRGDANGPMIESVGNNLILKYQIETKSIPSSVLARKVDEMAVSIQQTTGRKPGKKELKEIQSDARIELLPMAFAKQSAFFLWIDLDAKMLVVGTTNASQSDLALSALIDVVSFALIQPIQTNESPAKCMAEWLISSEGPTEFSIDRECELKSCDENKSTVRYAKHALDIDEVRKHIEAGKVPTKLAMTWQGRVSFLLTDSLQVKKLDFLEGVFENNQDADGEKFDADVAIATGELGQLIPALIEVLGGEMV